MNDFNRMITTTLQSSMNPISDANQLVKFASGLMILITYIKQTISHPNVAELRAQIIEELKAFEKKLTQINYPALTIIDARYCLCTALDEAVLSQPWGAQSIWVQDSLLNIFQKETWGGERFYQILNDSMHNGRNNADLIELLYFLLNLGFEGKYFGEEHRIAREEILNHVFEYIRNARIKPERTLSISRKLHQPLVGCQQKRSILKRLIIFSLSTVILFAAIYNFKTYRAAEPTIDKLNNLVTVTPAATFSDVIGRSVAIHNEDDEKI